MRDPLVPLEDDQQRALLEFARDIGQGHITLSDVRCYCGGKKAEVLAQHDRFGLPLVTAVCHQCGTVFSTKGLDGESAKAFYERYYRRLHPGAGDKWRRAMKDAQKGTALYFDVDADIEGPIGEVGAGTAETVRRFAEEFDIEEWHAVDLDPAGESVKRGDWKALPDELGTLLAVHVLEHCLDPVQTLGHWASKVRLGGRLVVVVPDFMNVRNHRYVKEHGAGAWFHLAHVWNWTRRTVRLPFLLAGLDVVSVDYAQPGALATVGSLVVVAERWDAVEDMVDYVAT